MRVATFNICYGTRGRGTATDHEALVAACVDLGADILALQEVDVGTRRSRGTDQAALVAEACGLAHVFVPVRTIDGGRQGNALCARGGIADVETVALRGRLRWPRPDRRGAVVAGVTHGDVALTVAVTHLSTAVLDNVIQERTVLDHLAGRPRPLLLLGDLNRRTEWVRWEMERAGLRLVDDDVPTAPARRPRFRIDHVAVDGFTVTRVEVRHTGVSDHCALVVDLSPILSGAPGPVQAVPGR